MTATSSLAVLAWLRPRVSVRYARSSASSARNARSREASTTPRPPGRKLRSSDTGSDADRRPLWRSGPQFQAATPITAQEPAEQSPILFLEFRQYVASRRPEAVWTGSLTSAVTPSDDDIRRSICPVDDTKETVTVHNARYDGLR